MSGERPHVSHGALYLYRDAADAWGWPDVLTTLDGKHLHLDPEEADAVAEVIEDARSMESMPAVVDELVARIRTLEAERAASGLNPGEIVAVPRELRERDGEWEAEWTPDVWVYVGHARWASDDARTVCRPVPSEQGAGGA